ncbi:MAG: xanthine dehydrogenase family protein molybdopterin-binding subunit [Chloroflexi bacterium]|nr:xanthine dehydrogenase family protein molybdopterin-binding subunit [Chloroflexota bacterium]MCI0868677.1 xanthine dehydrogenase family protein molybdopterin-binding subunit [Chloroflexota bacterium]
MTTTDYERNLVLSNVDYSVVGTRPIRPDGTDKVTGRALYGADFDTSGLLHGKVLRSPHAHAKIRSIDTSKAEALQGVLAVITGKDMPHDADESDTTKYSRDNMLAGDKVLYKGHAVAAVAAANPHVAEEALALIDVDYEVLKPVLTAPEGMKDGAPILLEGLRTEELGEMTDKVSNVAQHFQHIKGDIDKGFAEADVVVEREYNTVTVHQGYIEPQNATALWNNDGRLHIWCSTQGAFSARDALAGILGLPVSQIRVTPMEIGGGFGGKIPVYLEPIAALLSKKTGHAVKAVMSRADVFEATGPTSGSNMKIKIGAKNDGTITALQAYLAFEAGGYPGSPVGAGAICIFAPYDVENAQIDGYDVVVNKPKSAPYRAPGAPNAAFAGEQAMDEMAQKLGMDPIDFRLKNAAKEGTRRPDGPAFPRIGCVEVLEAMKNHPHYSAPLGPNQGRGVAIGYWFNIGFESSVNINVNADGTVSLIEGSTDIGGTRASIAMQAAEVLGIPMEDVRPTVVDTDSIGYTAVTGGSRTTYATGWAAYEAAQDVARQMVERAATIWDVDADGIELKDGVFQSKADPELKMTFKDLAGQLPGTGGTVVGRANLNAGALGAGGGSFAGNIVDVEVDPDTGKTIVTRMTAIQDAGKAIHPSYVEGQMQGGSVQGIGWALNEEYYMREDGSMANSTLLDYRMPTSLDLPMIDTVIVEVASPDHPYGVRGVGEANIVPPTPAIANAVQNATGTRMANLPINPVAIMEASWKKKGS